MRGAFPALASRLGVDDCIAAGVVATLCFGAVLGASATPLLQEIELAFFDLQAGYGPEDAQPSRDISLLFLTEANIRELGHWPISDRDFAAALAALDRGGARVIGLDIYRDLPVPPGEAQFRERFAADEKLIGVHKFGPPDREGVPGPWPLRDRGAIEREGFNDVIPDSRGRVRRALLFQDDGQGGEVDYAFALRVALRWLAPLGIHPIADPEHEDWLRLGATSLRPFARDDGGYANADDRGYQLLLNFSGAERSFPSFDFLSLIEGRVDPALIRDRIVLIGTNARSLRDFFQLPGYASGRPIAGVEVHANIVQQLLDYSRGELALLRTPSTAGERGLLLTSIVLGCALALACRHRAHGGALLALGWSAGIGAHLALGWLSLERDLWLPVAAPSAGWTAGIGALALGYAARTRTHRTALSQLFAPAAHLPLPGALIEDAEDHWSTGARPERLKATLLATRLHLDPRRTESMQPEELLTWLHELTRSLEHCVVEHGGLVHENSGLTLRASFGTPRARRSEAEFADDALRATHCARAMAHAFERAESGAAERSRPRARLQIGVHTGWVVSGCLGESGTSRRYSVLGNEVLETDSLAALPFAELPFAPPPALVLLTPKTRAYVSGALTVERVVCWPRREGRELYCLRSPS